MATLNENIAKIKENFRNIRDSINTHLFNNNDASIPPDAPTEQYQYAIHAGAATQYSNGWSAGVADGKNIGKGEIYRESKYIPKQATGKVIALNDVSEVYHKVKVYGDGEVDIYGKNLFDGVLEAGGINSENGTDYETSVSKRSANYIPIQPNTTYTVSRENTTGNIRMRFYDKDKNYLGYGFTATVTPLTFTAKENYYYLRLDLLHDVGNLTEKVQVEFDNVSPYEPYTHQTITATSNGTEVNSLCPNMTFLADTDITVDYYGSFGMAEKELAMWNALTNFGMRKDLLYCFSRSNFEGYTIPTGLINEITRMGFMFYGYQGRELPKGLDLSGFEPTNSSSSNNATQMFAGSNLEKIYDLKIPPTNRNYNGCYQSCTSLKEIEVHRSYEDTVYDNATFQNCTSLTRCIFIGVIANDLNGQWCPWDDETLISLGDAVIDLYDSGLGEGSRTLTLSDKCKQRLQELQHPTLGSYFDYIVAYKGWKIT